MEKQKIVKGSWKEYAGWFFIWLIFGANFITAGLGVYLIVAAGDTPMRGFTVSKKLIVNTGDEFLSSSTYKAEIKEFEGGKIIKVNGTPVKTKREFQLAMLEKNPKIGDSVKYEIERKDGSTGRIELALVGYSIVEWVDKFYMWIFGMTCFLSGSLIMFMKPNTRTTWSLFLLFLGFGLNYLFLSLTRNDLGGLHPVYLNDGLYWLMEYFYVIAAMFMRFGAILPALAFPEDSRLIKKHPWIFWGLVGTIGLYATVNFSLSAVKGETFDIPLYAMLINLIAGLAFLVRIIYSANWAETPISRIRGKMSLFGFTIAISGAMLYVLNSYVLDNFLNLPPIVDVFSDVFILFGPISMTYAMLRNNLFDASRLVRNSIFFVFTMVCTIGIYSAMIFMAQNYLSVLPYYGRGLYNVFYIILLLYLFMGIKNLFQQIIEKVFYRKKVDYAKVENEISEKLSFVQNVEEAEAFIGKVIVDNLFVEDVKFLIKKGGEYRDASGEFKVEEGHVLIKAVKEKKEILSHTELEENRQFRWVKFKCLAELARLECAFIMPVFYKEEMTAVVAFGHRKSGQEVFNLEDIGMLKRISAQVSVLLENMELYSKAEASRSEVEKLNEILEEKVKVRTGELEARAKDLEEQNAQIAFATHNKTSFLASMSHELRTPLTGILGFSDMAIEGVYGKLPTAAVDVLVDLKFNGKELLQLINDILDLSKIEAGKMELKMEDFSPLDAVEQSVGAWIREAEGKGIEIEIDHARNLPLGWGEEKRVKQALDTLLRNAVRWSQTKRITIRVTCAPEQQCTSKTNCLIFEVEDYGVGIESYRMPKLFMEHEYPQILDLQYYKNVGVGLALAKKWAELHGGEMWAESVEGKGSKFSFKIPLKEGVVLEEAGQIERAVYSPHEKLRQKIKMEEVSHQYKDLAGKRILSIEDNEANQKILSDYLRSHDCVVIEAMDGEDGLAKALNEKPDIIITDIQLPKMNGLEIIQKIRASEDDTIKDIPILIASSFAMLTDIDKGIASGGNAYLTKPYNFKEILEAVKKYLA